MSRSLSDYVQYDVASTSKKEKAALADGSIFLLLLLVLTGALFLPFADKLPLVSNAKNAYKEDTNTILSFVDGTRLQRKDGDSLVAVETGFKDSLKKTIKASYYYHSQDVEEPLSYSELNSNNQEVKVDIQEDQLIDYYADYSNDDLSYYFLSYRESHKDAFTPTYVIGDVDYSNNIYEYFYKGILKLDTEAYSSYLETGLDLSKPFYRVSILSKNSAKALHQYVILNSYNSDGKAIYDSLLTNYSTAVSTGINEIESSNKDYQTLLNSFVANYSAFKRNETLSLSLAFITSFLVYFVLLPLIFKDGQTLGMKVFHLHYERTDGKKPGFGFFLISYSLLFLSLIWMIAVVSALLGEWGIMTISLSGKFRFLYIAFFSAIYAVASLIFFFSGKEHLSFANYSGRLIMKDADMFSPKENDGTTTNCSNEQEETDVSKLVSKK